MLSFQTLSPVGTQVTALGVVQAWLLAPRADGAGGDAGAKIDNRGAEAARTIVRKTTLCPLHLLAGGEPLSDSVRVTLEAYFQADLRALRIHIGAEAPALGALAFTLGEHIHFAPGLFAPYTRRGLCLLGHEVAHVLQQRAGRIANPHPGHVTLVHDPALEREADQDGVGALLWLLSGCSGAPPQPLPGPEEARACWVLQRANDQDIFNAIKEIAATVKGAQVRANARAGLRGAADAVTTQAALLWVSQLLDRAEVQDVKSELRKKVDAMSDTYLKARVAYLGDERMIDIKQMYLKSAIETRHKVVTPYIVAEEKALKQLGKRASALKTDGDTGAKCAKALKDSWTALKKATDDSEKAIEALPGKALVPMIKKATVGGAQTGRISLDKAALKEVARAAGLKNAKGNFDAVFTGVAGRTGPTPDRNHMHVGGEAGENLLFTPSVRVIQGAVDFHMQNGLDAAKKKKIAQIEGRSTAGADTFLAFVDNDGRLHEVV